MAGLSVPRELFQEILGLIDGIRADPWSSGECRLEGPNYPWWTCGDAPLLPKHMIVLAFVAASVAALTNGARAAGWWGRKLPDAPTQFIFGYGSLINTASRNSTASAPIPAIPVRVSAAFGYVRAWNDRSRSGFTSAWPAKAAFG
jgi:hypothetical protein